VYSDDVVILLCRC